MTTNRLAKSEQEPKFDRKSWTPEEHCNWANAQLILTGADEKRRAEGLDPVHWVVRDKRVVMEPKPFARIEAFGRDRGTGLDAQHESRISARNYPTIPSS